MSILYVTGPVNLYVGTFRNLTSSGYGAGLLELLSYPSSQSTIRFLGTCESAPQINMPAHYKELLADFNGGQIPFDVSFCGETAEITLVLNKWNESVYKQYAASPRGIAGTRGEYTAADMGRLMLHEGYAMPLWAHFPFYTQKSAYVTGFGMPNGYRFIATFPRNKGLTIGTQAGKRLLQIQALPVYNPSNGTWKLFDERMDNIPTIPPYTADGSIV